MTINEILFLSSSGEWGGGGSFCGSYSRLPGLNIGIADMRLTLWRDIRRIVPVCRTSRWYFLSYHVPGCADIVPKLQPVIVVGDLFDCS